MQNELGDCSQVGRGAPLDETTKNLPVVALRLKFTLPVASGHTSLTSRFHYLSSGIKLLGKLYGGAFPGSGFTFHTPNSPNGMTGDSM